MSVAGHCLEDNGSSLYKVIANAVLGRAKSCILG